MKPSLRANGSRERAPNDRLREAIHLAAQRKNGLLRRFAPRNDVKTRVRALAERCARVVKDSPPKKQRARGMPGARCTRSLVCSVLVAHECRHHGRTGTPGIPAREWF